MLLQAIIKLYKELNFENPAIIDDINNDYLTEHKARNGRAVLWYLDGVNECAIYADTLEILTANEIENELM